MKKTFTNALGMLLSAIGVGQGFAPSSFGRIPATKPSRGLSAGAYGRGLQRHFNKNRRDAERVRQKAAFAPRDAHGSLTRTGGRHRDTGMRRTWLAGISAQRGF